MRTGHEYIADMLETLEMPGVVAVTIFEHLQDELGRELLPDSVRRMLERRIAKWACPSRRGQGGFLPSAPSQALSDFTVADGLRVTIAGGPYPYRLYHFRLACSGWEHVRVILGGESFSAVAEGLQDALWKLGGVPREHRTDSLSAAFKNLGRGAELDFTRRYHDLCRHYGMEATRNNPGVANEIGSIEAANGHIKIPYRQRALDAPQLYPDLLRARPHDVRGGAAPRLVTALSLTNPSCASHPIYRANRPGSGHPHSLYSATITPIMEATCGDESFLR
jgi:hypothetical protein